MGTVLMVVPFTYHARVPLPPGTKEVEQRIKKDGERCTLEIIARGSHFVAKKSFWQKLKELFRAY